MGECLQCITFPILIRSIGALAEDAEKKVVLGAFSKIISLTDLCSLFMHIICSHELATGGQVT